MLLGRPVVYCVLIVQPVAEEAPGLAPPERPADVAVEVVLLLDLVAAGQRRAGEIAVLVLLVGHLQVVGDVVGDHVLVLVVAVPAAREAIAARLDADAEHRAAGEGRGVCPGAADLELLEAAEVEVAGVGVGGLGGVDALEPGLVLVVHPVGAIAGLVAGARAADVVGGHLHTRRLGHRRPHVARVRDLGEQLLGEVGAHRGGRGVDDRRLAGDGDGFLQRGDLELLVDAEGLVDDDADAFALHGLEAGELEVDRVDTGRQRLEAVRAVAARDLHLGLDERRARRGDGDTRQNGAGVVGDGAVDSPAEVLRRGGKHAEEQRRQTQDRTCRLQPHGHPSRVRAHARLQPWPAARACRPTRTNRCAGMDPAQPLRKSKRSATRSAVRLGASAPHASQNGRETAGGLAPARRRAVTV